jgi:TPR repeat protein
MRFRDSFRALIGLFIILAFVYGVLAAVQPRVQYTLAGWIPVPTVKDQIEAALFRIGAECGSATAQSALGELYVEGRGVQQNDVEAIRWFRVAAEQGDAYAQCGLGTEMYVGGHGVEPDYSEALKWYRKSAEQGYPYAQFMLGEMYRGGLGVERDDAEALKWFRKAAEQDDASARSVLPGYDIGGSRSQ